MKFLIIGLLFLTGCVSVQKKEVQPPDTIIQPVIEQPSPDIIIAP